MVYFKTGVGLCNHVTLHKLLIQCKYYLWTRNCWFKGLNRNSTIVIRYHIVSDIFHLRFFQIQFHTDTKCRNKRSDCYEYGKQVCQSPYIPYKENCEQYCGFCGHGNKTAVSAFYTYF